MLKVTYLFHSGYWVETDHYHLIFDYITDHCQKKQELQCGRLPQEMIHNGKKVIAFVSHAHCDHFDGSVLQLGEGIQYVISDDVTIPPQDNIVFCRPYEHIAIEGLEVDVFSSTDQGVSFYLTADGCHIYHAGDFNWWHWEGDTEEGKEFARNGFFDELEKLRGKPVDIAMFPVDPRLEHAYCYGGKEYIQAIEPKMFFPMHFQSSYPTTSQFKKYMGECAKTTIMTIQHRGQTFSVDEE